MTAKCLPCLLLSLFLAFTGTSFAEEAEPDSTAAPAIVFPVQEVVGKRIVRIHSTTIERDDFESARFSNLSEAALDAAGVAGVRRNASQVEPVIRGLGWERVAVQLNHMPVYGACPGRMDPPLSYATGGNAESIEIVKGLPSVTQGSAGTAGRVIVSSAFQRSDTSSPWDAWVRAGADGSREGWLGEAGIETGNDRGELKAHFEALDYDDYTSANGTTVPARQSSMGGGLATNLHTGTDQRWWTSFGLKEETDIDYPSLPMDLDYSNVFTACTGYESTGPADWKLEAGYYDIDHRMDNEFKPNRPAMAASTNSISRGGSFLARRDFRRGGDGRMTFGADTQLQHRDATRERTMIAMDRTFYDRIWPDTNQNSFGLFGEYESPIADAWRMRLGLRGDVVSSRSHAADANALGGLTVVEAWTQFYGDEASDYDREEFIAAGNAVFSARLDEAWQMHLGAGLSSRAAGVTERYFAFAPAPGGFMIGNPALDREMKYELSAELEHSSRRWTADLSVYAHSIQDYILTTTVATGDFNNDGVDDRLRGFENADAQLFGFDGTARVWLGRNWSLPLQGMVVYGQNTRDDRPLSEIPPAEARIGLRYDRHGARNWFVTGSSRLVAEQDRIDEVFGENRTPGFVTFDLRGGARLVEGLWLDAGVLNLLDKQYHEHLTREALLPVGDLRAGQEVPAPGMSAYITLRYDFGA